MTDRRKTTIKIVQSFYCRSNNILTNFNMLKCMDVKKLHNVFCMNIYSSELLDLSNKYMNTIYILHIEKLSDACLNFLIAHIIT